MDEQMKNDLTPNDINKIEYTLLWITNNVQMRIGVNTYTHSKKERSSYYREVKYYNNTQQKDAINILLSPEPYLSITQLSAKNGYKADIKLNFQMAMVFKNSLQSLYNLLYNKYDEFYCKVGDKYLVKKKMKNIEINTMFGGYILLGPDIVEFSNGTHTGGVRIFLGDVNNSIVVPLNIIEVMYQTIESIDFFSYALQLLQLTCRPEFGSNRFTVGEKKGNNNYFHK